MRISSPRNERGGIMWHLDLCYNNIIDKSMGLYKVHAEIIVFIYICVNL
jgi:hypothetical protein